MRRSPHTKKRHLQFQGLEQRQLMAADLGFSANASMIAYQAPVDSPATAYVASVQEAATPIDAAEAAGVDPGHLTMLDSPAIMEQALSELAAEQPTANHGLGNELAEGLAYDAIEAIEGVGVGPVGGDDIGGPEGHTPTLDGANAQETNGGGSAHPNIQPGKDTAKTRLDAYGKGLDVEGKSLFQAEHACVSLDPQEYKHKGQTGKNTEFKGGSLFGSVDHTNKEEQKKEETKQQEETKPQEEKKDEKKEDNSDGGTKDDDRDGGTTDGQPADGGTTDEEVSGGVPDDAPDADQPDYGEGYVDPNDPIMQVAREFTNDYFWHTYEANQNGNVTPNPMTDQATSMEGPTDDYLDWIDAGHTRVNTDVPEWAAERLANHDDGHTDPVPF